MAYVTGTANSLADLLTAIQNACTANGWTLSGNVLHKGVCYAELALGVDPYMTSVPTITVRGGTGVDGSNALTGVTDQGKGYLGITPKDRAVATAFGWPVTYFVHVFENPHEVYAVAQYAVNRYQTIAFGQSQMPGLVGTGNWYCGCTPSSSSSYGGVEPRGEYANGSSRFAGMSLFCRYSDWAASHGVHHAFDADTWIDVNATTDYASLNARQPNQWNQESILMPIRVYAPRPSKFISPVLECAHARYVNIANLSDRQVITLGSDRWKVYPWFRASATMVVGTSADGSGPCGHAIRYDGP